jgi:hypothetical protein
MPPEQDFLYDYKVGSLRIPGFCEVLLMIIPRRQDFSFQAVPAESGAGDGGITAPAEND